MSTHHKDMIKHWTLPNTLVVAAANIAIFYCCPNLEHTSIAAIVIASLLFIVISSSFVSAMLKKEQSALATPTTPTKPFLSMEDYKRAYAKQQESQQKHQADVYSAIDSHIKAIVAPVVGVEAANTLCANYRGFDLSRSYPLLDVKTVAELDSTSIFHLAWNIGKRLNWNGSQITHFAKNSFPYHLRDASEDYIKCNLTRNPLEGIFKLDRPQKGSYEFCYAV
jgi:hypothetical protein